MLYYSPRILQRFPIFVPDTFFRRTTGDVLQYDFFRSFHANIGEDEQTYTVEIAVPGMSKKDIQVNIKDHVLSVTASKTQSRWWRQHEFNSTSIHRSFTLPANADVAGVRAKCNDGLLTITIPKLKSPHHYRVVPINSVGEAKEREHLATTLTGWLRKAKAYLKLKG
jgi:HSP20 family molecular chaperone IbpA